ARKSTPTTTTTASVMTAGSGSVFTRASGRLGPEEREQDDVADRRRVGQHHRESVHSHPEARRRRHAVLQGAHVVFVEVHRLLGAAALLRDLLAEALRLVVRIVQLTE